MQLMQYIASLFRNRGHEQKTNGSTDIDNSQNRALVWLGKDKLERQYFYEKWASQQSWQIYSQGLPLLLGRDPEDTELANDIDFIRQQSELWEHLKRCVERKVSPIILNPAEDPEKWQAEPVEVYRWAIAARLDVPEELDALLTFISSTIQPTRIKDEDQSEDLDSRDDPSITSMAREQILSVMLAMALQKLYQDGNSDLSQVRQEFIESIYTKSQILFNQDEPPLTRPALHDLFDRSLETTGLIHP